MRINYAKKKNPHYQKNCKRSSRGDGHETDNPIRSEFNKLLQKEYKMMNVLVRKMIHVESCNKLKFNYPYSSYLLQSEPVICS